MQMASIHDYRKEKSSILGFSLSNVPSRVFDRLHAHMSSGLQDAGVPYIGVLLSLDVCAQRC